MTFKKTCNNNIDCFKVFIEMVTSLKHRAQLFDPVAIFSAICKLAIHVLLSAGLSLQTHDNIFIDIRSYTIMNDIAN